MKINAWLRAALLALAALMTLSFAACQPQTSPENPDAPTDEQTTAAPETESDSVGSNSSTESNFESTEPTEKTGCKAMATAAVALTTAAAAAVVLKKKKD